MKSVRAENGIVYYRSEILKSNHGFSTRIGGSSTVDYLRSCNLGFSKDEPRGQTFSNVRLFCDAVGTDACRLTTGNQTHGNTVLDVTPEYIGTGGLSPLVLGCDGLVTDIPGSCVGVRTADCVPVLLEGRDENGRVRAVSAVHAGWRGTAAGIAGIAAERLISRGFSPKNIYAAIGPHIGPCCFETRGDCREVFLKNAPWSDAYIEKRGDFYFPDLTIINTRFLADLGIPAENTDSCGVCTCCNPDEFYSYRRTGIRRGSMLSVIGIAAE